MDILISSATQRSGSTLLQRIFNIREKTLIWGEHGGVLKNFLDIYNQVKKFSEASAYEDRDRYFESNKDPSIWIANLTPELKYIDQAIVNATRTFLDNLYITSSQNYDTVGIKEVRYNEELALFKECYPNSTLILLVRNPIDVWMSMPVGWNTLEDTVSWWNKNVDYYLDNCGGFSNTYLFRYEDIVEKEENTVSLLCDLAKITKKQFEDVLNIKISSTRSPINKSDHSYILDHCYRNMKSLYYI